MPVISMLLQKWTFDGNFKFAKFHYYQQTQSFLISDHTVIYYCVQYLSIYKYLSLISCFIFLYCSNENVYVPTCQKCFFYI
jgi:hypothetical protein